MSHKIIAIDQSTSATKAMLFDEQCRLLKRVNIAHEQYYPQEGWVEHDALEIYRNALDAIRGLLEGEATADTEYSLAITNQRETVVVWDRRTGEPVSRAVVWQCTRGAAICQELKDRGMTSFVQERSGLLIDPYFSASGVKWILDNVEGARDNAAAGHLLMGTIDSWLVWKLTGGATHATDYTNASRTLLFNIHTLDWDDELLSLFDIPRTMLPEARPCDALYGTTTLDGLFPAGIPIVGLLGDSHGALVGQCCFRPGQAKATYGTGSSVMMNIGENALSAPDGLVTSIGFAAGGKTHYAFEGNIHCTGATIKWLVERLRLIDSPADIETQAAPSAGGVYFVPAFAGLGAPWWRPEARAAVVGMSLATDRSHMLRAAMESIAYQVTDLAGVMAEKAGVALSELRVDGGPTRNRTLMQFQADMLCADIRRSDIEEASALGAVIMNGLGRGCWKNLEEVAALFADATVLHPQMPAEERTSLRAGWRKAVNMIIQNS